MLSKILLLIILTMFTADLFFMVMNSLINRQLVHLKIYKLILESTEESKSDFDRVMESVKKKKLPLSDSDLDNETIKAYYLLGKLEGLNHVLDESYDIVKKIIEKIN